MACPLLPSSPLANTFVDGGGLQCPSSQCAHLSRVLLQFCLVAVLARNNMLLLLKRVSPLLVPESTRLHMLQSPQFHFACGFAVGWTLGYFNYLRSRLFGSFHAPGSKFLAVVGKSFIVCLNAKEILQLVAHMDEKGSLFENQSVSWGTSWKLNKTQKPFRVWHCWEQGERHKPMLHSAHVHRESPDEPPHRLIRTS